MCSRDRLTQAVCSCCAHAVPMLCSCCAHAVLMLCPWRAHAVLTLCFSCCAHAVLMLCSCCAHAVLMLCSYRAGTAAAAGGEAAAECQPDPEPPGTWPRPHPPQRARVSSNGGSHTFGPVCQGAFPSVPTCLHLVACLSCLGPCAAV